jgi:hypothetical protein
VLDSFCGFGGSSLLHTVHSTSAFHEPDTHEAARLEMPVVHCPDQPKTLPEETAGRLGFLEILVPVLLDQLFVPTGTTPLLKEARRER